MATKRQKTRHLDTDAGNDTASEALQSREIALSVQNDGFLTPTRLGRAETKLDDFDFDTADNDGLKALVASPTDGPVIVTVYFQCRDGRRQPIGFGMYNTLKIRHDLASFVALESGHKQPFYLNMDILANRRVANWPESWRTPAWFHAAFKTLPDVKSLRPALERYTEYMQGLGCIVELEQVEVLDTEMDIWRTMQPPAHFLKNAGEHSREVTSPVASRDKC